MTSTEPKPAPAYFSVWQFQSEAVDYVCVGILTDEADALELAGKYPHSTTEPDRRPGHVMPHPTLESLLNQMKWGDRINEGAADASLRQFRDTVLEEAAQVCENFGVGHPNQARKIRELMTAKACGTCQGVGRDARDEGGRCQDCGGNGLAPGEPAGMHPRAEALRRRTEETLKARAEKFAGHPKECDGMRSGVCTCPAQGRLV